MHRATPLQTSFRAYTGGGARATIDKIDDSTLMQSMGGNFMHSETRQGVESPQNYGFTSVVMDGDSKSTQTGGEGQGAGGGGGEGQQGGTAEGFMMFGGSNRSFPVCLVMDDRRHRLNGLDKGDVAMFRTKQDKQQ